MFSGGSKGNIGMKRVNSEQGIRGIFRTLPNILHGAFPRKQLTVEPLTIFAKNFVINA